MGWMPYVCGGYRVGVGANAGKVRTGEIHAATLIILQFPDSTLRRVTEGGAMNGQS